MEWIDVNKEMPDNGKTCFITGVYKVGLKTRFYGTDVYMDGIWCDKSDNELMYITHWMPCEPPKID